MKREAMIRCRPLIAGCVAAGVLLAAPAPAQRPLLRNMEITDLKVEYTSGTLLLQQLLSKEASAASDGESLIGRDVTVFVHPPDGGEEIKINSPVARYYFAAPAPPELVAEGDPIEHLQTLRDSNKLQGAQPGLVDPVRGDFLLLATKSDERVEMDMGATAALHAQNLIWSEKLQKFLTLSAFEQKTELPEGRLAIDGEAFIADREFTSWTYPVLGESPVQLKFVPSQNADAAQGGISRLAAGGDLTFTVARGKRGEEAYLQTSVGAENAGQHIEARGNVAVVTPEFKMNAAAITYDPAEGILLAHDNVAIETPQLEAQADNMRFNTATEELLLSGNPRVLQQSPDSSATFTGMDEFALRQQSEGARTIELEGRRQFEAKFESTKAGSEASGPFGAGMTLQVAPGGKESGTVVTTLTRTGELSTFTADGSVVLVSESFNIRSDQLIYDGQRQVFEAQGNVFVQQPGVTADCETLVYDIAKGVMTMTGNPDITREEPAGTTRIWGCDSFVLEMRDGGSPDMTATGDNCQSKFTPKASAGDEAAVEPGGGGFLSQLSGGGEVNFTTGKTKDGTPGYFRITHNRIGEQIFEARGDLRLDTPELNLRARAMTFNQNLNLLTAKDEVRVRTPQIEAEAEDMVLHTLTQEVRLTGNPHVVQLTPENRSEFSGMEVFSLQEQKNGEKALELTGPREILIDIKPINKRTAPEQSVFGAQGTHEGLQKLGDQLNIVVAPHPENQPRVRSLINDAGELTTFTAGGSIVMKSNRIDLRCDQMNYNAPTQRFEATGHVFVKQQNVQADCGRLLYELDSGRIYLTVEPEVVQYGKDEINTITGCTEIVIQPRETGNPDIITRGDQCQNFINPLTPPAAEPPVTAPTGPVEIVPEQPVSVQ